MSSGAYYGGDNYAYNNGAAHTSENYGNSNGAPSSHNDIITVSHEKAKCNDIVFAILFLLGFVATVIVGIVYIADWSGRATKYSDKDYTFYLDSNLTKACIVASVIGLIGGFIMLGLIRLCNGRAVCASIIGLLLLLIAGAIVSAYYALWGFLVVCIIAFLINSLYFCCVRNRIPFSEAIVLGSIKSIFTYFGVIPVSILCALINFGYSVFWVHLVHAVIFVLVEDAQTAGEEVPTGSVYAAYILLCLAFYWFSGTVYNIAQTTVAGSVGTWWFLGSNNSGVTSGSFCRAITTSLGSIALGSLIVALIQTIRTIIRVFIGRNNLLGCCLDCIMGCVESIFRYFNKYAYTYIALYGGTYIESGKRVSELMSSDFFKAVVNDELTWCVVSLNSLIVGLVGCIVCGIAFNPDTTTSAEAVIYIFGFIISYWVASTMLVPVASASTATFVVWAEDPAAMQANQPDSFQLIADARQKFY